MPDLQPVPMREPFTENEIKKAVSKLKANKSAGFDDISVELVKYAPNELHNQITTIFNKIASQGDCTIKINHGILVPIQKPGKAKGPPSNLRPITLLLTLRKILAVAIMIRIGERMDHEIPISQAAYRKERSTTEHVFAVKMIIERTLNAKNETIYLTLLDMSKAFDTIPRKDLIEDLSETIELDELFIVKKMLEVLLSLRCGNSLSETFVTDTGTPQGDCASANNFTYYLAKSLGERTSTLQPDQLAEHSYHTCTQIDHINLELEYADDITKVTSDHNNMERYVEEKPVTLQTKGLTVNKDKTEKYIINRNQNEWRKCKLLGTILDSKEDMKRRKILAITAANNLNHLFDNDKLTLATKLKIVDVYIEPIFLYNSETWTLNKADEETIDTFHRKLLRRYVFNVKWPNTISNEVLYRRSKAESWRKKVTRRRLKWFGKLANLPNEVPANQALKYALADFSKPRGKPKTTWVSKVKKDLQSMNFTWDNAILFAKENQNDGYELLPNSLKTCLEKIPKSYTTSLVPLLTPILRPIALFTNPLILRLI